jgi:hypothetical protein
MDSPAPQARALRPWLAPQDMPATARVELSSAAGYEEARTATDAELPALDSEAEGR